MPPKWAGSGRSREHLYDRRVSDLDFYGIRLDADAGRASFVVVDDLVNARSGLYGGAALGASVAIMEAVTGRRAIWMTAQFVSSPAGGETIECRVEVPAHGARMSQVRVTATGQSGEAFTAIGACGEPREQAYAVFDHMPDVTPVEEARFADFDIPRVDSSYFRITDRRVAIEPDAVEGTGTHAAFWVRVDGRKATPALLSFFGDAAAFGIFSALGSSVMAPAMACTSIDNTLRVGEPADTEWVLLDIRAHSVGNGYGHGTVELWSPDGRLLGTVSQSLAIRSRRLGEPGSD
jgi:acyl-CoA thioesterase